MSKKELDQLYLTKNERLGVLLLFVLLLALIIIPWLYTDSELVITKSDSINLLVNKPNIDSNSNYNSVSKSLFVASKYTNHTKNKSTTELFEFDPNHLDANDAKRLGIPEKSYQILQNYLATGAKINTSKQFSKIYGINENLFEKIEPYIRIAVVENTNKLKESSKTEYSHLINLNTAESDELATLPGIGEKLAARIAKYRNILGGFTNKSQLNEIYGLQDSTIQKFHSRITINGNVKRIRINSVEYDSLKCHPYIGAAKARVICEYRKQHSAFMSLQDLYKMEALDSNWIGRISGYLSFEK